jgi:hypothetical protein
VSIVDRLVGMVSPRRRALRRGVKLAEQGQMKRAFPLLVRAATAGIAEAEFRVGRCYLEGVGVPASRAQGARWLQRAGDQGYIEAQALLATLYIHGMASDASTLSSAAATSLFNANTAVQPDFAAAEKWARRAADGGSADGQALLGYILTSGPESQRNLDEALRWYEKSAAAGCPQGHLGYALSLARGGTTPGRRGQPANRALFARDDHRTRGQRARRSGRRCPVLSTVGRKRPPRGPGAMGRGVAGRPRGPQQPDGRRVVAAPRRAGRRS